MKRMDGKKVTLRIVAIAIVVMMILVVVPSKVSAYTYHRQSAVNYALTYAENPNPYYRYFPGFDCTNFVSQCLYAGGWPKVGWNKYSSSHWFYNNYYYYSNTWTVADDFRKFLTIYSGRGYARSLTHQPWYQYFQVGDIVQIDYNKDGRWDHTMIITGINTGDMYVSYHSENKKDVSLNYLKNVKYPNARFMGYHLYDYF